MHFTFACCYSAFVLQPANYNVLINISYFISHLVVLPAKIQICWNIYIFDVKIIFSFRAHTDWAFLSLADIENSTLKHMKMKYFHVIITTLCLNDSIVRRARRSHVSKHEWDFAAFWLPTFAQTSYNKNVNSWRC